MHDAANLIILDQAVIVDDWALLRLKEQETADSVRIGPGKIIVPLKVWQAQRATLLGRPELGVWFASDERAETIRGDVGNFCVIAVDFPQFSDGRGYSLAYNLRARLGFTGQLRAIGEILRDQLYYLQRVGFNAFAPPAGRNIHDTLKGLTAFSGNFHAYQASLDQKMPLFRRVRRDEGKEQTT